MTDEQLDDLKAFLRTEVQRLSPDFATKEDLSHLATKADLANLVTKADLKAELAGLEHRLKQRMDDGFDEAGKSAGRLIDLTEDHDERLHKLDHRPPLHLRGGV